MFCSTYNATQLGPFIQQHRARLFAMARRRGLSPEDALDCVQNAFVTFLQHPAQPPIDAHPEEAAKFITTITKNAIRSMRRLTQRHERPIDDAPPPVRTGEQDLEQKEELQSLCACLLSLRENQRALVTLRFFEDVSGQDVAVQLGLSPQNVAVLLHRAKESLRGCMEAHQIPRARD